MASTAMWLRRRYKSVVLLLVAGLCYGINYMLLHNLPVETAELQKYRDTTCDYNSTERWACIVLEREFSITNGLDGLKRMALLLAINSDAGEGDDQLVSLVTKVHATLKVEHSKRRYLPKRKWSQRKTKSLKSLAFIKAYKVGGTLISSLLSTYVYNYDLNIDPSGNWSLDSLVPHKKYKSCVDVAGTHHPPRDFYQNVTRKYTHHYFCNDPITFMFVRDPVERLWSGYNHYMTQLKALHEEFSRRRQSGSAHRPGARRLAAARHNQKRMPVNRQEYRQGHREYAERKNAVQKDEKGEYNLKKYLRQITEKTVTPPHKLLSSSLINATKLLQNISIFSQDGNNMDISLIILAEKAELNTCDILYEPCQATNNVWSTSKCNDNKSALNESFARTLHHHVTASGELDFYKLAMSRFKQEAENPMIKAKLHQYLEMRNRTLKPCTSDISYKAWESIFYADPQVTMTKDKRWVVRGENFYSIVPTWVCMQALCRQLIGVDS